MFSIWYHTGYANNQQWYLLWKQNESMKKKINKQIIKSGILVCRKRKNVSARKVSCSQMKKPLENSVSLLRGSLLQTFAILKARLSVWKDHENAKKKVFVFKDVCTSVRTGLNEPKSITFQTQTQVLWLWLDWGKNSEKNHAIRLLHVGTDCMLKMRGVLL